MSCIVVITVDPKCNHMLQNDKNCQMIKYVFHDYSSLPKLKAGAGRIDTLKNLNDF